MAQRSESDRKPIGRFKSVQILCNDQLGAGSWGQICKAKCDDLFCAAKMLPPVFFGAMLEHTFQNDNPVRRFEAECELLSTLRHPNIVTYIGTCHDPDTRLPVLLMEFMEESLTQYLDHCSQSVPYHLQINICHDVALALSYLHANDIVHRDICSSSILLVGNAQVTKLSNFAMAVMNISNRDNLTICPGSLVYMPPEAVTNDPKYTEKLDCFSFGVVVVQILTRLFPKPDDRTKYINDPSVKYAITIEVPEIDRRQSHISKVNRGHPLLPIALDCLNDKDVNQPTAHQLCERIGATKESPQYKESNRMSNADLHALLVAEQQQHTSEQEHNREEIHRLREKIKQKEVVITDVFENAEHQRLASERELQNKQRKISELEQQLTHNQEETRWVDQLLRHEQVQSLQRECELFQARQQISDLQQQIHAEQQRSAQDRDQLVHEKDDRIRELERRLEQAEVEGLGAHVTGLQLLPQGDSWNVPRHEVQIMEQIGDGATGLVSRGHFRGQTVAVKQIHRQILQQVYVLNEFKRGWNNGHNSTSKSCPLHRCCI